MEKLLYSVDNLPLFQNRLYKTKKEALNCKMGQIELVQNTETGLIYNSKFDEKIMIYDKFYDNEQSNSEVFPWSTWPIIVTTGGLLLIMPPNVSFDLLFSIDSFSSKIGL